MAASMKMNQLIKKRDEIEAEIKALNEVLESQQGVGMDGPLVDGEGFPRADIDVYSVRHARHTIICLENDYKSLMSEIEEELYKIHAEARKSRDENMDIMPQQSTSSGSERLAFGTVTKLDEGSPADSAGLKIGDKVIQFGSVTADNFQGLHNIATIVQHSIGKSLPVTVRRADKLLNLNIIPQKWHKDKGLLGCTIHPEKGLKIGDKVIQFGSVTADNFQGLHNIATIVQHSIGKSLPVTVRRADKLLNLNIIPQKWHKDKGLLGCTIHPEKVKSSR